MKATTFLFLGLGIFLAGAVQADTPPAAAETTRLDASALDILAGPIALYPDTLLAVILPASTNPADIVLAARYLANDSDTAQIDNQPWDASVRALTHYPDVLRWMDENLAWTQQLGAAFIAQPEDVMAAVQRLRSQAQSVGNLSSNEQLTVVNEDHYIRIIPTRTEVVYVPYYDPAIVYVRRVRYYYGPAWPCGPWLSFDCNWIGRCIWIGTWSPSWYYRPVWRYGPPLPPHLKYRHTWRPNPHRPPPPHRPPGPIIQPRPHRDNPAWAHANPPRRQPRPPNYQRPSDLRPSDQRPSDQRPSKPPPGRNPGTRPPPRHHASDRQDTSSHTTTTHLDRHTTNRPHYDKPDGADNRPHTTTGNRPNTTTSHPRTHVRQSASTMTDRRAANTTAPREIQRTSPPPRQQQAARQSRPQSRPSAQPAQSASSQQPRPSSSQQSRPSSSQQTRSSSQQQTRSSSSQQPRPSPPPARTQSQSAASSRSSERQDKAATSSRSSSSHDSSRQQTRSRRT